MPTEGKVIRILNPTQVVVNLGEVNSIAPFTSFLVFAMGEELEDPDTQEVLGRLEIVRGRGRAIHVQDRITTIESSEKRRVTKHIPQLSPYNLSQVVVPEDVEEIVAFDGVCVGDLVRKL
jgi:hypothetical protein